MWWGRNSRLHVYNRRCPSLRSLTIVVIGCIGAVVTIAIESLLPPMVATLQWCRRLLHRPVGNGMHGIDSRYSGRVSVRRIDCMTGPRWSTITTVDARCTVVGDICAVVIAAIEALLPLAATVATPLPLVVSAICSGDDTGHADG